MLYILFAPDLVMVWLTIRPVGLPFVRLGEPSPLALFHRRPLLLLMSRAPLLFFNIIIIYPPPQKKRKKVCSCSTLQLKEIDINEMHLAKEDLHYVY